MKIHPKSIRHMWSYIYMYKTYVYVYTSYKIHVAFKTQLMYR